MTPYIPQQRQVQAQILTPSGWLKADFHLAQRQSFMEFLDHVTQFFSVTDVTWKGSAAPVPFLALQRTSTLLIVPVDGSENVAPQRGGDRITLRISCLFEGGILEGDVEILKNTRMSDYLGGHTSFIALRKCRLTLRSRTDDARAEYNYATVLVNASRVIGVSEVARLG